MRAIYPFNDGWLFLPQQVTDSAPDSAFEAVTLPHSNALLPVNHFHDAEYQFISTYRKRFHLPEALDGRRLYLDFEGAMLATTVSINGHALDEHKGGYTPFSYDITDYLHADGENVLTVHLDSTERPDIPPFGYVVDYLTFGGIYREVHLRYVAPTHITNARVKVADPLSPVQRISVDVFLNHAALPGYALHAEIINEPGNAGIATHTLDDVAQAALILPDHALDLWTLENPRLYSVRVTLTDANGHVLDVYTTRFGVREAVFRDDGFYLNGERVFLRGLNRHQTYPTIGAAAPARLQRKDAEIIKHELGCNIVRTSHYPQSKHFLNRCDEIGLLVFEEIPGWQHIGDEAWQAVSLRDVQVMIERDWNHPSIVVWGVRINESWDNTDFYTRTNALARQLDPTRQTTGVRFWPDSELLEDVYGYNDFTNAVLEPTHTPWLITEFNGHMFPTKTFDNEERQVEHAIRHARIQAQAIGTGGVSGAIGWCAFDYNTHKEFGSGDRICYHGVMDIFRLPKYAAYVYASQIAPTERVVLHAATIWAMGDRSAGGNDPLYIFSNCDEIDVYAGKDHIGRFAPNHEEFPYLPHPPFKVTGLGMRWGEEFGDLHVIGYVDGAQVAEQWVACDGQPERIVLSADDAELHADGADMTRIIFKVVDCYGNRLPYTRSILTLTLETDTAAQLIGENPTVAVGGQGAVYLKAGRQAGAVTVTASAHRLSPVSVQIKVEKQPQAERLRL